MARMDESLLQFQQFRGAPGPIPGRVLLAELRDELGGDRVSAVPPRAADVRENSGNLLVDHEAERRHFEIVGLPEDFDGAAEAVQENAG